MARRLLGFAASFVFAVSLAMPISLAQSTEAEEAQIHYDVSAFEAWLADFRTQALQEGIAADFFDQVFQDVTPLKKVLELDGRQPEFTRAFGHYLSRAISEARISEGRKMLAKHDALLKRVDARYNVQPRFLVAFWGLETNYGGFTGSTPIISALTTLAFNPRRADFFRGELLEALKILQAGHISQNEFEGSWAGAMGQLQFMPSTFASYAVDANDDGKRDIWTNLPDVFASAANYLSSIGWKGDETWGREVSLPSGFDFELTGFDGERPIAEWQALGVRRAEGWDLPKADIEGAIILPGGHKGPAFLVYNNFRKTMIWNRSTFYALAIGILADRLVGRPALVRPPDPNEPRLHRDDVEAMQRRLQQAGHDPGEPDGRVGPMTRKAIKSFQSEAGLPPDGYPDEQTMKKLWELFP